MLIVIIVFFENGSWAAAQHHLSFVHGILLRLVGVVGSIEIRGSDALSSTNSYVRFGNASQKSS